MRNALAFKPDAFPTEAASQDRRLRAQLTPAEIFALGLNLAFVVVWVGLQTQFHPYDYNNYVITARRQKALTLPT